MKIKSINKKRHNERVKQKKKDSFSRFSEFQYLKLLKNENKYYSVKTNKLHLKIIYSGTCIRLWLFLCVPKSAKAKTKNIIKEG